jgi:PAS domain-containing protein
MVQPVELILARNLISGISLPALLCDCKGTIVFFNDAAGELLGERFEETGTLSGDAWDSRFRTAIDGESRDNGEALAHAVRGAVPIHRRVCLVSQEGRSEVELSTVPLRTVEGCRGSIVLLWQAVRPTAQGKG